MHSDANMSSADLAHSNAQDAQRKADKVERMLYEFVEALHIRGSATSAKPEFWNWFYAYQDVERRRQEAEEKRRAYEVSPEGQAAAKTAAERAAKAAGPLLGETGALYNFYRG